MRRPHSELDELAFELFKLFAQYEYALKATGYLKSGRSGQAEPDWEKFANEVGRKLLKLTCPEEINALNILLDTPPKKQLVILNRIEWRVVDNSDKSAHALFGHIRRVRNNLYHGGKFNGHWFEPERSQILIKATLLLLRKLMSIHKDLQDAIESIEASS